MTSRSPASHTFHCALSLLLAAVPGLLAACSARDNAPPAAALPAATQPGQPAAPPSQPARRADPELTAEIGFSHAQSVFRIENRDTFAWSNCQFNLNATGKAPGYTEGVASVKPGVKETAELRAGDFTNGAGRKFDPAAERVATLDFSCDTPQGRLHGSQFLLGEPPGHGQPPGEGKPQ
jgi:hypothetical protein